MSAHLLNNFKKQGEDMRKLSVIITPVTPAYIPVLCPVCRGHKTVNWGKEVCGACHGEGFLKVPPKEEGEDNYGNNSI